MRKISIIVFSLAIILILVKCGSTSKPELKGFYQTEKDVNGHVIQLSIQHDDNSFVEYIDNREVDRGTYEKSENGIYFMKSDKQSFEINLNNDNSFDITVKNLNDGNPIKMINLSKVPTTFPAIFDDVDEYQILLGE